MVDIQMPTNPPDDFVALIPDQRVLVNKLMSEGKINAYTLSLDRTKLWAVISADSERDVFKIIATFPLRRFMEWQITELAFHNSITIQFPQISLN